jgi:hypothetical protein
MPQEPQELAAILTEIERALAAKLYYLAIAVTLSVPDICACLEFDPDNPKWANRGTYVDWCNTNLGAAFKQLTGDDLYNLRGGVIHKGHFDHDKSRFDRVMFLGPESRIKMHETIMKITPETTIGGKSAQDLRVSGDVLMLGVKEFCESIMEAARKWSIAKAGDPFVARNLPNLVRYRPNGLPPFSIGVPTIA